MLGNNGKSYRRLLCGALTAVLALLTACGAGGGLTPSNRTEVQYTSMQLIGDTEFREGFKIIGQNTKAQGNVLLYAEGDAQTEAEDPVWMIAQWNSGLSLYKKRAESAPNVLTEGVAKTVTLDTESRAISLRLNTIPLYDGEGGTTSNWPHLLLEQYLNIDASETGTERMKYYSCSADRIILSMDIRMTSYEFVDIPGVNAAQFLSYYYIKSKTGDDFVWFGAPLFDNRGETGIYWAVDTAGSDRMIYSISSYDTYKNSAGSMLTSSGEPRLWTGDSKTSDPVYGKDGWIHVEVDLKPHIEAMFERGMAEGTFKYAKSLEDLYISGMNIGFETIGSFDITVELKNLRLTGELKLDSGGGASEG